jgi:hypothetical protein
LVGRKVKALNGSMKRGTNVQKTKLTSFRNIPLATLQAQNCCKLQSNLPCPFHTQISYKPFVDFFQELVGSAKKRRQFLILGGLCGLAVIVIAAIVLSVVLIKGSHEPLTDNKEKVKLEEILTGRLLPKRFNGTWIDDNSFQFEENVS